VDPAACIVASNGFDPGIFFPDPVDRAEFWRHNLVDDPQGWRPRGEPGSVHYTADEVAPLAEVPVLVAVGRFTAVKRLDLLIRAFTRMRRETGERAALVLVGGHPGEWEGEHPLHTIAATGTRDIFLAGWHDHDALPGFLNAADALVLASVREQFGLVLVEGMACGLPAIAVDRLGPAEIVREGVTGWLVPPDDEAALARALASVVADPVERERRGERARGEALSRWAWPAVAETVADVLDDVAGVEDANALLAQ
jgi:glycosyltransferase involved in cell wall biosynthesis